ncbi:MAG TPA: alpha/beta hydrolase [Xanthobacteraceae bacterium]|nr:alpha/beta hydrolase [Xanthobacteraceae bacterium]
MWKRIILVVFVIGLLGGAPYAAISKWAIRHDTLDLFDATRNRPVTVDIAVRRDAELRANAGLDKLKVAIINHGYTVKSSEYSFLANVLAARGYLVASIQHDLPTDPPLSQKGELYVGRMPMYERGVANIMFAIGQLKEIEPNADYDHLVMLGHSNGGDISMFFAGRHPNMVTKVVTLDNLRVPFLMNGRQKILSFRSNDWKPDDGVVPSAEQCKHLGIDVEKLDAQHTEMSDRGPETVKEKIVAKLKDFLNANEGFVSKVADRGGRRQEMYEPLSP